MFLLILSSHSFKIYFCYTVLSVFSRSPAHVLHVILCLIFDQLFHFTYLYHIHFFSLHLTSSAFNDYDSDIAEIIPDTPPNAQKLHTTSDKLITLS